MNVTEVVFSGFYKTQICGLYQYDYGQVLKFTDITLPSTYEVHFAQSGASTTVTVLGDENGVQIPDQYLLADLDIRAYIYLHEEETDGETVYQVLIPVIARPEPTDVEPTPVEQDIITQTIAALNSAVDTAEGYAADASQSASDSAASAISAQAWAEAAQESAESIDMSNYATKAALQSEENARALADTSLGNEINAETQRATAEEASIRLAIPNKTSQLQNDSGFLTSAPVQSVNGKTGAVSLSASDVGALPSSTVIPSKTSDLQNDSHFITASEAPVQSVNGQTGAVTLPTATTSSAGLMSSQDKVNLDAVRGQIGDLKNAFENGGLLITTDRVEQGSYNSTGATTTNTARIRTKGFIPVENGGIIKFTAGANAEQIFYGKFDSNKKFIGDGTWSSGNIEVTWNGYVILVFRRTSNGNITPSDYDAETLVMPVRERRSEGLNVFATAENPMNPLLFDKMYFKKGLVISGTEYLTEYSEPRFNNNQFDDLNSATASSGNSGYMAFGFNALNKPKILASGETLTMYLIAKVNKAMSFIPRLSTSVTWTKVYSVAVAPRITLKAGYNCVKLEFTYDHTGTDSRSEYRFFSLEGNTVYTDLEAEIMLVSGEAFLGWVKGIEEITGQSFDTDLLFWGDSLTAGAGGGDTSYPKVCAETLGLTRINCGVGGESANTISARQGGNNVVIPVGNVNGTYTTLSDIFGASIAPLLQGNGSDSGNALIIDGQTCTLTHSTSGYTISGYTGDAITVPKIARFRGSDFTGKVVVIFVGQNGATFTGLTGVDARIAIIDSMIKHIGHERYVIMGLSTGTNTSREADDNQMLAHYGNKFFPTRTLLVEYGLTINGLTATEQDETDIANGTVPTSLRSDGVHMNAYGYTAIGRLLADKIRSLGYID